MKNFIVVLANDALEYVGRPGCLLKFMRSNQGYLKQFFSHLRAMCFEPAKWPHTFNWRVSARHIVHELIGKGMFLLIVRFRSFVSNPGAHSFKPAHWLTFFPFGHEIMLLTHRFWHRWSPSSGQCRRFTEALPNRVL